MKANVAAGVREHLTVWFAASAEARADVWKDIAARERFAALEAIASGEEPPPATGLYVAAAVVLAGLSKLPASEFAAALTEVRGETR